MEHRLFRNRGAGRFEDVTRSAGIAGHEGRGLAVVCGDYDQDGDTDILVANDETRNFLWVNNGKGRLEERAAVFNFAYNERGVATAGMGLDLADVDGNGTLDVIESDFQGQRKTLYVNDAQGFFTPNAGNKGLGDMPVHRLGFGIGFFDYDLDGWPDIFIANGHVNEDLERDDPRASYEQTAQLFHNQGDGRYADASDRLGEYGRLPRVGRGTAFGDYDNDGDTDLLVTNNGQPAALLRNENPRGSHWIGVRCVGKQANRSGLGVRISLDAGGRRQIDETRAASSYLSSSDPRVVFGLGGADRVERVTLHWPDGTTQELQDPPVDRYLTVTQGESSFR
jgi:hypothetical protein